MVCRKEEEKEEEEEEKIYIYIIKRKSDCLSHWIERKERKMRLRPHWQ